MSGMYEATQVGKREDLGEGIFNVDADQTPFTSGLRTGAKLQNIVTSWQVEALPNRDITGVLDGTDVSAFNSVNRTLIEAVGQWMLEPWFVSKLANLTTVAGVKSEKARQAMKAIINLKMMFERRALCNLDLTLETGATPNAMRGAMQWIQDTAQALKPVNASFRPNSASRYTGAIASLDEATFLALCVQAYNDRKGAPLSLDGFVGVDLKAVFDNFVAYYPVASTSSQPSRIYTAAQADKTVMRQVDTLKFSVGEIRLQLTPNLCRDSAGAATAYTPKSGIFVDLEMWEKRFMQAPMNGELPPNSGGPRGYVDMIGLVACNNPLGSVSVLSNS